jgi:DnaJ-class molecular chaperone
MKNEITKINNIDLKPTHVGQRCPVCNSFGTLRSGSQVCHGCHGKGYILIPVEEAERQVTNGMLSMAVPTPRF